MTETTPPRTTRLASLTEKTILGFIAGAAAAIAVVDLVLLITRIVEIATAARVELTGVPLAAPLPAGVGGSDALVSAEYDTVALLVDGLSGTGRAALIAAAVVGALLSIGLCVTVAWLCLRVFVGKPFVRSATWAIGVASILVIVAGLGAPALTAIANAEAALLTGSDQLPPFLVGIDLTSLGWGLALAVIAGAFEIGQRLQRDSDGLV